MMMMMRVLIVVAEKEGEREGREKNGPDRK
jgi:hypothetical protein